MEQIERLSFVTRNNEIYFKENKIEQLEAPAFEHVVAMRHLPTVFSLAAKATTAVSEAVAHAQPLVTIQHSDRAGELKRAFLQSLEEAKESIVCLTYSFSDPDVLKILLKKAEAGVKVTLVIDKDHMSMAVPYASKFTLVTRTSGEGRIHHKITVIDGEGVWIGSANLSPDALTRQDNTMIYLKSKEMAQALHEEAQAFLGLHTRSFNPLAPFTIEGQKVELLLFPHVPFESKNPPEKAINAYGKQRILDLIQDAKSTINCAICVLTDPELAQALIDAQKRGVAVEILLWKAAESDARILSQFASAGISVLQKPHLPLMHNKWMLVDNQHFLNCSANWSKSWFSRNDESAILLNNLTEAQVTAICNYWNILLHS